MFSITLKRSAATLGVVAGLLAAAAPANAQFWEGMSLKSQTPISASQAPTHHSGVKSDSNEIDLECSRAGAFALELEGKIVGVFTSVSNVL